jgi:hypothetical protein
MTRPDFAKTRTHWHTGRASLLGEPGDALLFGADKKHELEDALRHWLALHPASGQQFLPAACDHPSDWVTEELARHGSSL